VRWLHIDLSPHTIFLLTLLLVKRMNHGDGHFDSGCRRKYSGLTERILPYRISTVKSWTSHAQAMDTAVLDAVDLNLDYPKKANWTRTRGLLPWSRGDADGECHMDAPRILPLGEMKD
jgi:hypothetical protein